MKLGVVYGFKKGRWIKHSTDSLLLKFKKVLLPHGVEVLKVGLLDSRVEIRNSKLVVRDAKTKKRYSDLDGIYIANWRKSPEIAMALARYMQKCGKQVMNVEIVDFPAMTKLGEMVRMADKKIPMPDSFFVRSKYLCKMAENYRLPVGFSFPLILKSVSGSMGVDNWLIRDFGQFREVVNKDHDNMLVVQKFIPNDCDYRVLIFGGEIKAVMRRSRQNNDTHLNNTSAGGRGDMVSLEDFPDEWKTIALRAATAVNRSDLAGVDIIVDKETGKPFILEVNKSPQIETGSNIDAKTEIFAKYIMEKFKG